MIDFYEVRWLSSERMLRECAEHGWPDEPTAYAIEVADPDKREFQSIVKAKRFARKLIRNRIDYFGQIEIRAFEMVTPKFSAVRYARQVGDVEYID